MSGGRIELVVSKLALGVLAAVSTTVVGIADATAWTGTMHTVQILGYMAHPI